MRETIYTGITIGPIGDTMQLTSAPGGLWAASYLFSWIAEKLISNLVNEASNGISRSDFVSPMIAAEGELLPEAFLDVHRKGVGMFHDHIIFRGDGLDAVNRAYQAVLNELAEKLNGGKLSREECREWLEQYLRVYALTLPVADADNPILAFGGPLDALELEPHYVPKQTFDPLLYLFENANVPEAGRGYRNDQLRHSFLTAGLDWMLLKRQDGVIRDLADIAARGRSDEEISRKWEQYYAILYSDGDFVGNTLKGLRVENGDLSDIQHFSLACLDFCSKASRIILDYGGLPIYAGGDDLLTIVPLFGKDDETSLFQLVEGLNKTFDQSFEAHLASGGARPTLSLGIAAQYKKSPLYEALDRARASLAKAKAEPGKNALCFDLQKHSGQSVSITINHLNQTEILSKLDKLIRSLPGGGSQTGTFLSGAGYQVEAHEDLFKIAVRQEGSEAISNLFDNLFDNISQEKFREDYLKPLEALSTVVAQETFAAHPPEKEKENGEDRYRKAVEAVSEEAVSRIKAVIRLLHFLQEKKGGNS